MLEVVEVITNLKHFIYVNDELTNTYMYEFNVNNLCDTISKYIEENGCRIEQKVTYVKKYISEKMEYLPNNLKNFVRNPIKS